VKYFSSLKAQKQQMPFYSPCFISKLNYSEQTQQQQQQQQQQSPPPPPPPTNDTQYKWDSTFNITQSKLDSYLKDEQKYNAKLVYVGQLTKQLKTAKTISITSSVVGICLLPSMSQTLASSGFFAKAFVLGTTGFFIFVTPLLLQFITRRYVIRMYYNKQENKCTLILFNFFLREYALECSLDDIFTPDIPGPFQTVSLRSNNRKLFIHHEEIPDFEIRKKIYGFDKPLDFEK
jgi:hypothetical protein